MTLDRSIGPRCNIGPAEISRRRRTAIVFTIVASVVAIALVVTDLAGIARLGLWPFATAAAVTWLQVVHRFCVAFGAIGVENLGALGQELPVDTERLADDRRRAVQIVLEGSLIGAIVTLALVILPI